MIVIYLIITNTCILINEAEEDENRQKKGNWDERGKKKMNVWTLIIFKDSTFDGWPPPYYYSETYDQEFKTSMIIRFISKYFSHYVSVLKYVCLRYEKFSSMWKKTRQIHCIISGKMSMLFNDEETTIDNYCRSTSIIISLINQVIRLTQAQ